MPKPDDTPNKDDAGKRVKPAEVVVVADPADEERKAYTLDGQKWFASVVGDDVEVPPGQVKHWRALNDADRAKDEAPQDASSLAASRAR